MQQATHWSQDIATPAPRAAWTSTLRTCPFCGGAAALQADRKHGKPYMTCSFCGSRLFLRSLAALRAIELLSEYVEANREEFLATLNSLVAQEHAARANGGGQARMAEVPFVMAPPPPPAQPEVYRE